MAKVKSMLLPQDEKNLKRLLALEAFGEKAINKAEAHMKQIYTVVVNGKKVKKEYINSKGGTLDDKGRIVYLLKPQFVT